MTDLNPRALGEAADEIEGFTFPGVPARAIASAAIIAYLAVTQPTVETVEGLEGLPVGTIILDRFEDESYTRIVGPRWVSWVEQDGLRHTEVALPARVVWRPQS